MRRSEVSSVSACSLRLRWRCTLSRRCFLQRTPSLSATACSGFMMRVRACTMRCRCQSSGRKSRFFGSREGQRPRSRQSWHRSTPKARGTVGREATKGKARMSGPFSGVRLARRGHFLQLRCRLAACHLWKICVQLVFPDNDAVLRRPRII